MSHHRTKSVRNKVIDKKWDLFRKKHTLQRDCGPCQKGERPQNTGWLVFMGWVILLLVSWRIISIISGKVRRVPGIGPLPTFDLLWLASELSLALVGMSYSMLMYCNELKEVWGALEIESSTGLDPLILSSFSCCVLCLSSFKGCVLPLPPVSHPDNLWSNLECFESEQEGTGNNHPQNSLVAQWMRIQLPVQGTRFSPLSRKTPHAVGQISPCTTTTEASGTRRACAPNKKGMRSLCTATRA